MKHCLKCQGSLRFDREFPGMVCQRCGNVYYFNPYPEIITVGEQGRKQPGKQRRNGGWHKLTVA